MGTQYRSIILVESDSQRKAVTDYIERAGEDYDDPIRTEVAPLSEFYPAEEYHQDYYEKNRGQPYCSSVISPKIDKVEEKLGF